MSESSVKYDLYPIPLPWVKCEIVGGDAPRRHKEFMAILPNRLFSFCRFTGYAEEGHTLQELQFDAACVRYFDRWVESKIVVNKDGLVDFDFNRRNRSPPRAIVNDATALGLSVCVDLSLVLGQALIVNGQGYGWDYMRKRTGSKSQLDGTTVFKSETRKYAFWLWQAWFHGLVGMIERGERCIGLSLYASRLQAGNTQ